MKKIVFILLVAVSLPLSAQEQSQWLTDNKVALKQSETQNKPVLVYVTDNEKSEASALLNKTFFSSEAFKNIATKVVLLKLDISDKTSYNLRLGTHYTKQKATSGVSLINTHGNAIIEPLVDFSSEENILAFMTLLNDKL